MIIILIFLWIKEKYILACALYGLSGGELLTILIGIGSQVVLTKPRFCLVQKWGCVGG